MPTTKSKKHGNNEGSLYKRSDGRYAGQIALPGDSRIKRRRKWVYGKTRADVASKMIQAQKALIDGLEIDIKNVTFESYARRWLRQKRNEVRQRTWEVYESRVRVHLIPAFAGKKLSSIKRDQIQDLYAARISGGTSARTVRHIHTQLQAIFGSAERDGLLIRNVAKLVKPPRAAPRKIKTLSPSESRALIKGSVGHSDEALFVLAITTGLRIGELLALRWEDLEIDKRSLRVMQSITWHRGGWSMDEPKTSGSRRQVTLSDRASRALLSHQARQAESRLIAGSLWNEYNLIFASGVGTPRSTQNVTERSFRPLLKRLGLPNIRFHDLRHTAASLLLAEGIHPKIVSEMLGHASVQITLDTYSHVTPTMQRAAANAMDSLLTAG